MATIGSLNYKIVADTQGFTKGIVATRAELRDAAKLFAATREPAETLGDKLDYLRQLYEKGAVSSETYQRSQRQIKAEHEALDPATQAAAAAQAKLDAALSATTSNLQTQIATWGMSAEQTERWRLAQLGASDAALKQVEDLQAQRAALQAQSDSAALAAQQQADADALQAAEARQLETALERVTGALREQIATSGMSAEETTRWRLAQQGASQEALDGVAALQREAAALREHEAAAADARKLQTEIERLSNSLREEAATAGMSADQTAIWRLKQQGATDATLDQVRALQRLRDQAHKSAGAHNGLGQSALQVGQQHLGAIPGVSGLTDVLSAGHPVLIGLAIAAAGVTLAYKAMKAAADWYVSSVGGQLDAIDELAVKARTVGTTVQDLRELREAAQQLGNVKADVFDKSITKLTKTIGEANAGGKQAQETLRALNLDAGTLSAAGSAESLRMLADRFAAIEDPAERVRLAVRLFGREGHQMVEVLAGGSAAIDQVTAKFRDYAGVISAADTAAVEAQGDAWDRVGSSIDGIAARAAADLAPTLELIALRVSEILDPSTSSGQALRMALEAVPPVLTKIIDLADIMIGHFQKGQASIMSMANIAVQAVAMADKAIAAVTGREASADLQAWAANYAQQAEYAMAEAQKRFARGMAGGASVEIEKLKREAKQQADAAAQAPNTAAMAEYLDQQEQLAEQLKATTQAAQAQAWTMDDLNRALSTGPEATIDPLGDMQRDIAAGAANAASTPLLDMDAFDQMAERGRQLAESLRTPSERMANELDELRDLFSAGAIDAATYERALVKTRDSIEKPIVTKYEVDGVAAAVVGSQEAAAAIARHRRATAYDTYGISAKPDLPELTTDATAVWAPIPPAPDLPVLTTDAIAIWAAPPPAPDLPVLTTDATADWAALPPAPDLPELTTNATADWAAPPPAPDLPVLTTDATADWAAIPPAPDLPELTTDAMAIWAAPPPAPDLPESKTQATASTRAVEAAADRLRVTLDRDKTEQASEFSRQAALLQRIADTLAAIDRNTAEPSLQVQEVSL